MTAQQVQADRAALDGALTDILKTDTGRRLLIAQAHQGINQEFVLNRGTLNQYNSSDKSIYINAFNAADRISTDYNGGGRINTPFTLAVIVGHELGHSIFGYHDTSVRLQTALSLRQTYGKLPGSVARELTAPGDNVRYVENPLRRELGLPSRPSYVSPALIKRYFPEIGR